MQPNHIQIAAFYKFAPVEVPARLLSKLKDIAVLGGVRGTILIAPEGVNVTVSGDAGGLSAVLDGLRAEPGFAELNIKYSASEGHPFQRLKVKLKDEIVRFGRPEAQPAFATGIRVEPEDWNRLIADPDVVLIDTRNNYEFDIGTFADARNPKTRSFSEFPDFVRRELVGEQKRKIAMFCTGGIRCEKASAYLLNEGFNHVYQLEGGILAYLERIPPAQSLWQGECFVFDERVALRHGVRQGQHRLCGRCGYPIRVGGGADSESCPSCNTRCETS